MIEHSRSPFRVLACPIPSPFRKAKKGELIPGPSDRVLASFGASSVASRWQMRRPLWVTDARNDNAYPSESLATPDVSYRQRFMLA